MLRIIINQTGMEVTSKHHGHHMDYYRFMGSLFHSIGLSPRHAADEGETRIPYAFGADFPTSWNLTVSLYTLNAQRLSSTPADLLDLFACGESRRAHVRDNVL